ncbi:MAG: Spy/CpxP family protein refolding chaperone [Acidobacteriia bacterium]|nr:Spy/CpxP family protein refolding chaperone [Terriglobia bacterium]
MKRNIMQFASAAALAAGMAFAQAPATQTPPAKPGIMRHAMRKRMMKNLNLTDAQKQQAKDIFQQARQTAKPVRDQLKQDRQTLATAVKNNDTATINQLATAMGPLQGQLTAIRSGAAAKFYSILTPDQKAKADQMHQRAKQFFEQRRAQRNG